MSTLSQFFGGTDFDNATASIPGLNIKYNPYQTTFGAYNCNNRLDVPFNRTPTYFCGGNLVCICSNVAWIVAPDQAQVERSWYCKEDANTVAQACTGCTGWFVPTVAQLQNPGYACRSYWDSYTCNDYYWSSSDINDRIGCDVNFANGVAGCCYKSTAHQIRSFRCVTY